MTDTAVAVDPRRSHERDEAQQLSEPDRSPHRSPILRALPWAVVVAALVGALLWTGTPATAILRYGAYWVGGVVLPGTLVFRALRGSRGNLPEDVGFGAVTGFAVQLIGWALCVGAGLGGWLRLWPVLVIAPFVAVPSLRRHWSLRSPEPMRLLSAWLIAGIMLFALATLTLTAWGANPLPPATHTLFGDIYYHWANAAELRRTVTPQQPQMAGEPLIYHWFSDAYRGSASMLSGVPLPTVMLRLWAGPIAITSVLVLAGLGRQVSGLWWSGPVAAFVAVVVPVTSFWPGFVSGPMTVVERGSPTLTFSIPVVTVVVSLLVDIARGVRLGRGGWILFAVLMLLATGSKSSSLPVLFGGMVLAAAASWLIHRRPPWTLLASFAGGLLVLAATRPTLAGGEAGASLQFGAWFTFRAEFYWLTNDKYVPGSPDGGLFPIAWQHMPWGTRWALFALAFAFLFGQIGRLAGLAALLRRPVRRDVAAWMLAGITAAGFGGALLINHVAAGEEYFAYSAIPAEAALTAWLLAAVAPARRRALVVLGGLLLGWITGALLWHFGPGGGHLDGRAATISSPAGGRTQWETYWRSEIFAPVGALAAVVVAGVLLWWLLRRRWTAVLAGAGAAILAGGVVGLGVDTSYRALAGSAEAVTGPNFPSKGNKGSFYVSASEMRAAQWLARHAPTDDIVATNVHCERIRTTADGDCVNRSFWVSAITEHAVVLEGWAYQPGAMVEHGVNGLPYYRQPAPDAERRRINDAVFADPTPQALAELRDKYHAKWLYADTRASAVSPLLASLARERYRSGTAIVYELAR